MHSTHRLPRFLCGIRIICEQFEVVQNTFPVGKHKNLPFNILGSFRKFITPRLFIYTCFRIWYGLTLDEIFRLPNGVTYLKTPTAKMYAAISSVSCLVYTIILLTCMCVMYYVTCTIRCSII
jgi:hypothetical protein